VPAEQIRILAFGHASVKLGSYVDLEAASAARQKMRSAHITGGYCECGATLRHYRSQHHEHDGQAQIKEGANFNNSDSKPEQGFVQPVGWVSPFTKRLPDFTQRKSLGNPSLH